MLASIQQELREWGIEFIIDQPLKEYTTFQIGGPADYFAIPRDERELSLLLKICQENQMPFFILGHGSNILFTDKGFRGMIIYMGKHFTAISHEGNVLTAQAGAMLKEVSDYALAQVLDGMVFACGIPGTMGGAVFMNAGAYGGEMKQVVAEVKVMDGSGKIHYYSGDDMDFGYRRSRIQQSGEIILEVKLNLKPGNYQEMKAQTEELTKKREEKQPLSMPSAGSTFKRPEGYFAGKLIMDAGLSGYCIGGAMVSPKHCGFVVNKGNASFADVMNLVEHIKATVEEKFQVKMQPEIRIVGER